MKVKLKGNLFTHAMEYNQITLQDEIIQIHNRGEDRVGFIKKFKNPITIPNSIEFVLNKKDYSLLSTLEEFYVEKGESTIFILSKGFKAKFADMNKKLELPNFDDMKQLNVNFKDVLMGVKFAEKPNNAQIQYDGVTLRNDRIIASNSYCIYQSLTNMNEIEINLPKEVFKHLNNKNYTIKSNGKIALFENENDVFYTELLCVLLNPMLLDKTSIVSFGVNRDELLAKLKIVKEYTTQCALSAHDGMLELSVDNNENKLELSLFINPINLKKLFTMVNISNLLKMISAIEDEEVILMFDDKMLKICSDTFITASGRINCANFVVEGA